MTWPKTIRVCERCGALEDGLLRRCRPDNSTEHTYKAVPVIPASIADELAVGADAVLGTVEGIERVGDEGAMEEFEESCHDLADALQSYHDALGEETE